jgi:hypothetical protein
MSKIKTIRPHYLDKIVNLAVDIVALPIEVPAKILGANEVVDSVKEIKNEIKL